MNNQLVNIFCDRVINELEIIDSGTSRLALVYVNTSTGLAQLHDAVKSAASTETIADQICELATMWRDADPAGTRRAVAFQTEARENAAELAEALETIRSQRIQIQNLQSLVNLLEKES